MLSMVFRGESAYLASHGDGPEPVTTDYYTEAKSEPAGRWWGPGIEALGLEDTATREQMEAIYDRLEDLDGNPLGSRPLKYTSFEVRLERLVANEETPPSEERMAELRLQARRQHKEARHYIDATFSPAKSWSVLHAALSHAGRHADAERVWDCWMEGVHAGMNYWMAEAGITRTGNHAVLPNKATTGQYIEARDWVVSEWRHHTSRDGDPQLHVHMAILNRVRCADGKWRAIYGQGVVKMRPAAAAVAERVAEEALVREFGVEFAWDGQAREIVGVSKDVRDLFSSRRRSVSKRAEQLIAEYEAKWGVEASAYTKRLIAEQATLSTRRRKPDAQRTPSDRIDGWEMKLRHTQDQSFADVLARALPVDPTEPSASSFDREAAIQAAISDVSKRTMWRRADLIFELRKYLPAHLDGDPVSILTELADEALSGRHVVSISAAELVAVPDELRRSDGGHIFAPQNPETYASAELLSLEDELVQIIGHGGAPHLNERDADALIDSRLNVPQSAFVRRMLTSDKAVECLVSAAGGGKTFAVVSLAESWKKAFGRDTFGLAVSQAASNVMEEEGLSRTANIAQWLAAQRAIEKAARIGKTGKSVEKLRAKYLIEAGDLLVIDEASMVDTQQMTEVVRRARAAGARVLLAGDPEQMTAVGHSGAFNLVLSSREAIELDEVKRFIEGWEGPASVSLRAGDEASIIEYERHGRLVGGSEEVMRKAIVNSALSDGLQGKSCVVVTDTNERASEIASEIREARVRLGEVEADGADLADGTVAGVGDTICLRKTDHRPLLGGVVQDPLANRDTYVVTGRSPDGRLRVRRVLGRDDNGQQRYETDRVLPADYVAQHVSLAYSSTVHSAQGRTTDTSYVLVTDGMDWRAFYTGMTRGRLHNVAYICTPAHTHRHEVLLSMMRRVDPDLSASQTRDLEWETADHLANHGSRLSALKERAIEAQYDEIMLRVLGADLATQTKADPASAPLYRLVRSHELDGLDPQQIVRAAANERSFVGAESVAKVLHSRIERQSAGRRSAREEQSQTFVPRSYVDGIGRQQSSEVERYAYSLGFAMDARRSALGQEALLNPPDHLAILGPVPDDPVGREDWAMRAGEVQAYRERWGVDRADAIGPCPNRGAPERRAEWRAAYRALGSPAEQRPMAERTDGELRSLVAAHERQKEFEPPNVDERMKKAIKAHRFRTEQATTARADLKTMDRSTDEAAELLTKAERYQHFADLAKTDADRLSDVAAVRSEWLEATRQDRERHDLAKRELRRRYPIEAEQERAAEASAVRDQERAGATDPDIARQRIAEIRQHAFNAERQRMERQRLESTLEPNRHITRDSR